MAAHKERWQLWMLQIPHGTHISEPWQPWQRSRRQQPAAWGALIHGHAKCQIYTELHLGCIIYKFLYPLIGKASWWWQFQPLRDSECWAAPGGSAKATSTPQLCHSGTVMDQLWACCLVHEALSPMENKAAPFLHLHLVCIHPGMWLWGAEQGGPEPACCCEQNCNKANQTKPKRK